MKVSGILAQENSNRAAIKSVMQHFLVALDSAACAVYAKNWLSGRKNKTTIGNTDSKEEEEEEQYLELLWATDMDEQIGQDHEELEVANYVVSSGKSLCRMIGEEMPNKHGSFFAGRRGRGDGSNGSGGGGGGSIDGEGGEDGNGGHVRRTRGGTSGSAKFKEVLQKTDFDMIHTEALESEGDGRATNPKQLRKGRLIRRASMLHQHSRLHSVFGCPLFDGSGEVIGCVIFGNKQPLGSPFTEEDQLMVKHFVHHISLVLINSHLREVERQATMKTDALLGVARMANRSLEIGTLIRGSMEHFQKLLQVERCLIYVFEEDVSWGPYRVRGGA